MKETAKELLRKTKVIRDNFYPEPIEPEHEDALQITFEFLSEVINYLENDTDELSFKKLQEIRVEELKDFSMKTLQAELKNQKLQEHLNNAKKALTEISGGHTVEDAIFNHQLIASKALKVIGGDND